MFVASPQRCQKCPGPAVVVGTPYVPRSAANSFQDVSGRKHSQFHGLLLDETQHSRPSRPPLCRSCRRCRSEHCLQICFHFGCLAILFAWVGMRTPHLVTVGKWSFRLESPILKLAVILVMPVKGSMAMYDCCFNIAKDPKVSTPAFCVHLPTWLIFWSLGTLE